jgi:hypothetical protein
MLFLAGWRLEAQVVVNEIHYHPVENPAFQANGTPVLDLTEDVHEFVELRNAGSGPVDVSGWKLTSAVDYTIPSGQIIPGGGFLVIARNPARIAAVYGLGQTPLGPYTGKLSNDNDSVRVKDAAGNTVDSVNYSSRFPWAITADGLGANESFTGRSSASYQYRGRSLQRVSPTASSNDPANWIAVRPAEGAASLAEMPTPGSANLVTRAEPKPVVVAYTVYQTDESQVITPGQPVVINCTFSSGAVSEVQLQYFVDDPNSFVETRSVVAMSNVGPGQYSVSTPLAGQIARSIVRFRIRANRGDGVETVFPRADDPAIVPVSLTEREGWSAYFVQPPRTPGTPAYEFFIWDDTAVPNDSVDVLNANIEQGPRRIVAPDPPGYPRDDPPEGYPASLFPQYNPARYPAAGQPKWNGTVPAILVHNGVVHDIQARYHGSIYRRSAGMNSWKFTFPAYRLMDGKQRILVTEKGNENLLGYALFHEAGLPAAYAQKVDLYRNNEGRLERLEITDNDEETLKRHQAELKARNPQEAPTFTGLGSVYKSKGLQGDEGPYGWAAGQLMPERSIWKPLDRYMWSYPLQNSDWLGHTPFLQMMTDLWTARGDRFSVVYPNGYSGSGTLALANLRAHLSANWDVSNSLTYLALRNWSSPWDDKFHNHLVYRQPDGKWTMMPWDFDGEFATGDASNSIFAGKRDDANGSYSNNSRGPNYFKDTFFRAFEAEYRQRMFVLNNTLLHPDNLTALGLNYFPAFAAARHTQVNNQLGLGPFLRPARPVNVAPANGGSALPPATLQASSYSHGATSPSPHVSSRWEIREAAGSYRAPLYAVTSTTQLTSLAIPFDLLNFGTRYFWRVTYLDAQGHPSFASEETSFAFGAVATTATLLAIDAATSWRYNKVADFSNFRSGPDDPSWWASRTYNDSVAGWASGAPLIGEENDTLAEPLRTRITRDGRMAFYFRKRFNFPGSPVNATVRMRHMVDDGMVVYINGVELPESLRFNMPSGPITSSTPASSIVSNAAYSGVYTIPASYFVQGENVIAVEVHQIEAASSDVVFGLTLEATIPFTTGDVSLNEVLADNRSAVSNGGRYPDYVELYNNTFSPVDIGGWSLTDDVLNPLRYRFPAGTIVPAQGYLVVFCDNDLAAPGLHTGFGLSSAGQGVALVQGSTVKDYVEFGPQAANLAIGRVNSGTGSWALVAPSPNASNAARALGSAAGLKLNEWMASPASGEDWFEIYNPDPDPVPLGGLYLSDTPGTPTLTQIPALSFIAGRGFTEFVADGTTAGANRCKFKLSGSGENLVLTQANSTTTINLVTFGAQTLGISQGRIPDGSTTIAAFPQTPTPGASNYLTAPVVINEALASSRAPLEDAIELFNPAGAAVDISGWWLSDDQATPQKIRVPAGTVIPAGGFKVFYEDELSPTPATPAAFALSSLGDEIVLSAVDAQGNLNGYRSEVKFGASAENVSLGRIGTAGGRAVFWPLVGRTFGQDSPADVAQFRTGAGAANAAPKIGPLIVNEIMYHPPDGAGGSDNARDEFIELHNVTTAPIDVSGWRIKGESDFTFPAGARVAPGDYVLLVSFNPADAAVLNAFRAAYGVSSGTAIHGPFSPKLPNSTATIELAQPVTPSGGGTQFVMVDRVEYADFAPWPAAADGGGSSLQRISRSVIGDDAANWNAAAATPGAVNSGQTAIFDSDADGLPDSWEVAHRLKPHDPTDALLDLDGDGNSNAAEFVAGTNPRDPMSGLATQVTPTPGGFVVRFTAAPERSYTIQYRDETEAGSWRKLADVPASDAPRLVEFTDPAQSLQRFYRVVTPTSP